MNTEGHMKQFNTQAEAITEGFDIPVDPTELTDDQLQRLEKGEQPVVKMNDRKSKLAKRRMKAWRNKQRGSNAQPAKKKRKKR